MRLYQKALFCLIMLGSLGCGFQWYRLQKVLSTREQVLDPTFSESQALLKVQYREGKGAPITEYTLIQDPKTGNLRPPELYSNAAILLEAMPGVDPRSLSLQVFVKSDVHAAGSFEEVHTLVGEIPGELANSVTFIEDLFPLEPNERLIIYPDDISGPYQGTQLSSHDWIMLKISSPQGTQKILFEYVKTGLRVSAGPQLLLSTGLNIFDLGVSQIHTTEQSLRESRRSEFAEAPGQIAPSELDLALTFSVAFGYRAKSRNDALHWLGDNLTLILDIGVGSPGEIKQAFTGGEVTDQLKVLQNQLLFGAGLQFFDFLSVHLMHNFFADVSLPGIENIEPVLLPEVGLDVGTAVKFSSRLYERLFKSTVRRSRKEPLRQEPASTPSTEPSSTNTEPSTQP